MLVRVATLGAILALGATLTGCTVDDAMYYDQGYAQPAYGPNTVVMSPPPQPQSNVHPIMPSPQSQPAAHPIMPSPAQQPIQPKVMPQPHPINPSTGEQTKKKPIEPSKH